MYIYIYSPCNACLQTLRYLGLAVLVMDGLSLQVLWSVSDAGKGRALEHVEHPLFQHPPFGLPGIRG